MSTSEADGAIPSFEVVAISNSPEGEGHLNFESGELLEVLLWNKFGWWWGRNSGGELGWLHSSLVQPAQLRAASSSPSTPSTPAKDGAKGGADRGVAEDKVVPAQVMLKSSPKVDHRGLRREEELEEGEVSAPEDDDLFEPLDPPSKASPRPSPPPGATAVTGAEELSAPAVAVAAARPLTEEGPTCLFDFGALPPCPVGPPLPLGPAPSGDELAELGIEDGAVFGEWTGPGGWEFNTAAEAGPLWPPLPSAPPAEPAAKPQKRALDPSAGSLAATVDNYMQSLGFTRDGRVAQGGQQQDRSQAQLRHYFDYDTWAARKNREVGRSPKCAVPTGDGGWKHRLGA